ncbi:toprim domain-containing protein [Psychrobacillus sp. FSL K6-1464]|uniref:toprim domain-containing protein n=1 Tax=Psychrobacillus sp. FSL K6-1464 TaxID=2921545 RepID=UPI004046E65D
MLGFIVEGFHDEDNLKLLLPTAYVVVTNGTRLNNRVRMDIDGAISSCEKVFLLTDPDEAGELLAGMIKKEYPCLLQIHLDSKMCMCYRNNRWKTGVEHCELPYLESVLRLHVAEI